MDSTRARVFEMVSKWGYGALALPSADGTVDRTGLAGSLAVGILLAVGFIVLYGAVEMAMDGGEYDPSPSILFEDARHDPNVPISDVDSEWWSLPDVEEHPMPQV